MKITNSGERLLTDYTAKNSPHFLRHHTAYVYAAAYLQGKKVLDNGCGSGYGSFYLAAHGAADVTGIDLSETVIEQLKQHYHEPNLTFLTADSTHLPFEDASFDGLTSFQVIEHIKEAEQYLQEIKRVLKNGGTAFISTPNKRTYSPDTPGPGNPFHVKEYYLDEFEELLHNHFTDVTVMGVHQSQKVEQLQNSTSFRIRKKIREYQKHPPLKWIHSLVPGRLLKRVSERLNKKIDDADFYVSSTDLDASLDLLALLKK